MPVLGYDKLIEQRENIFIENSYRLENFQLASYELRAGSKELLINGTYYKTFTGDQIEIPSHQITFLSTEEIIKMPASLMGQIILRFGYSTKGLDLLAGHVDPLFEGRLVLIVRNHSDETITILPGDPIANIVFHEVSYDKDLPGDVLAKHSKKFDKIPHYIIDDWKGRFQPDIYEKIKDHKAKIEGIENQITTMNSTSQIVITGGIVLVATTILSVVLQVIFASWNSTLNFATINVGQELWQPSKLLLILSVPVLTVSIFMIFMVVTVKLIFNKKHKLDS